MDIPLICAIPVTSDSSIFSVPLNSSIINNTYTDIHTDNLVSKYIAFHSMLKRRPDTDNILQNDQHIIQIFFSPTLDFQMLFTRTDIIAQCNACLRHYKNAWLHIIYEEDGFQELEIYEYFGIYKSSRMNMYHVYCICN